MVLRDGLLLVEGREGGGRRRKEREGVGRTRRRIRRERRRRGPRRGLGKIVLGTCLLLLRRTSTAPACC